jgi:hypothetical protein
VYVGIVQARSECAGCGGERIVANKGDRRVERRDLFETTYEQIFPQVVFFRHLIFFVRDKSGLFADGFGEEVAKNGGSLKGFPCGSIAGKTGEKKRVVK